MATSNHSHPRCDHPAMDLALRVFRRQEEQRLDPLIAILGPPGCGKSDLLHAMLVNLSGSSVTSPPWKYIMLDLLHVPMGSDEEMYRHLVMQFHEGANANQMQLGSTSRSAADQMENLIREAATVLGGRFILAIDHINSVPIAFAQEFSQRLRALKESEDTSPEASRFALAVAGSLSLTELANWDKSAFHMAQVIRLPTSNCQRRQDFIRRILEKDGYGTEEGIVHLLDEETSADPSFLGVALYQLRKGADIHGLKAAIEGVSWEEIPHLRYMALHWHQNESLREIVTGLLAGHRIARRSMVPDIDEHQLTGVVVLDETSKPHTYNFRNRMVERFIRNLNKGDLPSFLKELKEIRNTIRRAPGIDSCFVALRRVWEILTGHAPPIFHIAFVGSDGKRRVFVEHENIEDTVPTVDSALTRALRSRSASFALGTETVSFAIPLSPGKTTCWIVCTTTKSGEPFTEFYFEHWCRFIASVADTLESRAADSILERKLVLRPEHFPAANDQQRPVSRVVLSDEGAILVSPDRTAGFDGKLDRKWAQRANRKDFVTDGLSKEEFDARIEELGDQVISAVQPIQGLIGQISEEPAGNHWVVSSDPDGLKIPIELLSIQRTPLCLHTGIARQIIRYLPPKELRRPLSQLLAELRNNSEKLRVLLVGVDPDEELPVDEEIALVKQTIEEGCGKAGMVAPVIRVLKSREASRDTLSQRLSDGRPYHIFHFCGHGLYTHIRLNKRGKSDDVASSLLKEWLRGAGIFLSFMSACYSGQVRGDGLLTSSGMIEDLLGAGIPNIVAFRWAVSAKSSAVLAAKFYERLLTPGVIPVAAMWEARRVARAADEFSDSWASSLLITQCPG